MHQPAVPPRSTVLPAQPVQPDAAVPPFTSMLARALRYGLAGGASLGALYGSFLFPIVGTLIGAVYGAVLGLGCGFANGIVLAGITVRWFRPIMHVRRYRRTMRSAALGTTALAALAVYAELGRLHEPTRLEIGDIPGLLALSFAYYAAGRGATWYIAACGAIEHALPRPVGGASYDPAFLQQLFDDMQDTYERVSAICALGFGQRWRRQLIGAVDLRPGMHALDLMTGTGETWAQILPRIGDAGTLTAVDFAPNMLARARIRQQALTTHPIGVLDEDALQLSLPSGSVDAVICAYGVKTLSPADQERFAREIVRVLRPGGSFGVVEMTLPERWLLRVPYRLYLAHVVPTVGALFLGNPAAYRMLSRYVAAFDRGQRLEAALADHGCTVRRVRLFFGCAVALVGTAPDA